MVTRVEYPKFRGIDLSGNALVGGKLYTYEAGTSTPKASYTDPDEATPNTNPVILDSRGECVLYGSDLYKLILKTSDDVTLWTMDNVGGIEQLSLTFSTVSDLRAQAGSYSGQRADVLGHAASGDGGGGPTRIWVDGEAPGTYVDNDGEIVVPGDGSAAWIWISGAPQSYMAWGGFAKVAVLTDNITVFIDKAFTLTGNITLPSNITVIWEEETIIDGAFTLTIEGPMHAGIFRLFGDDITVVLADLSVEFSRPEWWYNESDYTPAIESATNALGTNSGQSVKYRNMEYLCNTAMDLNLDYVRWDGTPTDRDVVVGSGTTIKLTIDDTQFIHIHPVSANYTTVYMSKLTILGIGATASVKEAGVYLDNVEAHFEDIAILGFGYGIKSRDAISSDFNSIRFAQNVIDFYFEAVGIGTTTAFRSCKFKLSRVAGVEINNMNSVDFYSCLFESNGKGAFGPALGYDDGVGIRINSGSVGFYGCYWEANLSGCIEAHSAGSIYLDENCRMVGATSGINIWQDIIFFDAVEKAVVKIPDVRSGFWDRASNIRTTENTNVVLYDAPQTRIATGTGSEPARINATAYDAGDIFTVSSVSGLLPAEFDTFMVADAGTTAGAIGSIYDDYRTDRDLVDGTAVVRWIGTALFFDYDQIQYSDLSVDQPGTQINFGGNNRLEASDVVFTAGNITAGLGADILINGNMELDSDWPDYNTPVDNSRVTSKYKGTYGRRLEGTFPNGMVQRDLLTIPDITYRISMWTIGAALKLNFSTAATWYDIPSALNWTYFETDLPASRDYPDIYVSANGGVTFIDEMKVREISEPTFRHNSNFALGQTGGLVLKASEATVDVTVAASHTLTVAVPTGATVIGVQLRVDVLLVAGDDWTAVWDDGAPVQTIGTGLLVGKNYKFNKFFDTNANSDIMTATTNIVITRTAGGNFVSTNGKIKAIAYYWEFEAMDNALG